MIFRDVLIHCLPRARPVTVVVDDQHSTDADSGIQMHELMVGGFVPIRVQSQQRDPFRSISWNRIFNLALHEHNLILLVSRVSQVLFHFVKRTVSPDETRILVVLFQMVSGRLASIVLVNFRGPAHPVESVEQMQSSGRSQLHQGSGNGHHASTLPHATLDDVAQNVMLDHILDTFAKCEYSLGAGHGEPPHVTTKICGRIVEVGRKLGPLIGAI